MQSDDFVKRMTECLSEKPDYPGQQLDEELNRKVAVDMDAYNEHSDNLVPANISNDKRIIGLYYMSNEQLLRTVKAKETVELTSEHLNITLTPYVDNTTNMDELTKLISGDEDGGYVAPYTFSFVFNVYFAIVDIIREKTKRGVPNPRDITLTDICERVEYSGADTNFNFRQTRRFRTLVFSVFNSMRKTSCFARPAKASEFSGKLYDTDLIDAYCSVEEGADVSRREVYINIIALSPLFLLYEKEFILLSNSLSNFPNLLEGDSEKEVSRVKLDSKIRQVAWRDLLLRIIAIAEEQGEISKVTLTGEDGTEEALKCRMARIDLDEIYDLVGSTNRTQNQRIRNAIEAYFQAHSDKFVKIIPLFGNGHRVKGYLVYIKP